MSLIPDTLRPLAEVTGALILLVGTVASVWIAWRVSIQRVQASAIADYRAALDAATARLDCLDAEVKELKAENAVLKARLDGGNDAAVRLVEWLGEARICANENCERRAVPTV